MPTTVTHINHSENLFPIKVTGDLFYRLMVFSFAVFVEFILALFSSFWFVNNFVGQVVASACKL